MSAHHGPPCGHTVPGTCAGCGGPLYDPAATARIEARVRHYGRMIKGGPPTPAQRDAVSAHWSAQLRAKVAASAAADKARETSVVVDPEDW